MPIYESDAWRKQYFDAVTCPLDVHIPTDDIDAYRLNPRHRWVYYKLLVAQSQGLGCGAHDVAPRRYPVFSKPAINLKGMGVGSAILRNERERHEHCRPGHCWMTLLTGEHVSSDIAVVAGRTAWFRHTRGIPAPRGTFDYWIIQSAGKPALERFLGRWIRRNLSDYTGMLNIESIGGHIIETHLRFADQWPDLYGAGWLDSMVRLYQHGEWQFDDRDRQDGYSIVLFGPHDQLYSHPPAALLAKYRATPGILSLQITFAENVAPSAHSMPPGGFRLAVINTRDFRAGERLRSRMARDFGFPCNQQREQIAG